MFSGHLVMSEILPVLVLLKTTESKISSMAKLAIKNENLRSCWWNFITS